MVMGTSHVRKVVGSKICIVCLKRPKINQKEPGVGPFFEKIQYLFTFNLSILFLFTTRTPHAMLFTTQGDVIRLSLSRFNENPFYFFFKQSK